MQGKSPQEGHLEIDRDRRPGRRRCYSRLSVLGQPAQYGFQGTRHRDQEELGSCGAILSSAADLPLRACLSSVVLAQKGRHPGPFWLS